MAEDSLLSREPKRPIRNGLETVTDAVPRGPLGFAGKGNLVGGFGYFATSTLNGLNPVDGINIGFNGEGGSVERLKAGKKHTLKINAWSKDVARFAAKEMAAPSTVDFFIRDIEVISIEEETPRRTASTWEVVVMVQERELPNGIPGMGDESDDGGNEETDSGMV